MGTGTSRSGSHPSRSTNDFRKLQHIQQDLKQMKQELMPEEPNVEQNAAQSKWDDFQRAKFTLNQLLHTLRTDVTRLTEMRQREEEGQRSEMAIRLSRENHNCLQNATGLFLQLKQIHEKDQAKLEKKSILGRRSKLTPQEMADRKNILVLFGKEIFSLTTENSGMKLSQDELEMHARVEQAHAQQESARKEQRAQRTRERRRRHSRVNIDLDEMKEDLSPQTEQERAFQIQVDANRAAEDVELGKISLVLDDLKDIAQNIHKELTIQETLLKEVDDGMDDNIANLKNANRKLRKLLKDSGGCSTWIPRLILVIILLALVGLVFGII